MKTVLTLIGSEGELSTKFSCHMQYANEAAARLPRLYLPIFPFDDIYRRALHLLAPNTELLPHCKAAPRDFNPALKFSRLHMRYFGRCKSSLGLFGHSHLGCFRRSQTSKHSRSTIPCSHPSSYVSVIRSR